MGVKVTKATGVIEEYSEDKIRTSAKRVGVPDTFIAEMLAEIRAKLYDGIPTSEIFRIVRDYLAHSDKPHLASKYNLKAALAELGPSGYPFEQYVSALLQEEGYITKTNEIMMGKCVSHEVDVIATKDGIQYFIEAKFHTNPSQRTDVRVPLYIRARYEDISAKIGDLTAPWIVTNTRFSSDAIAYSNCVGIRLTSWGYPQGEGITDMIERTNLHPLTMLDTLTTEDKKLLLSQNIVVCRQLLLDKKAAELIPEIRRQQVLDQVRHICEDPRP